jgi:FKBP-type peptidyl-prolyl cis-trans isomerase
MTAVLVSALSAVCFAQAPAAAPATAPAYPQGYEGLKQRVSYSFGVQIGQSMKQEGVEVDVAALAKGMADALAGAKPALTPQQMVDARAEFEKAMTQKLADQAQKNLKEGQAYLEKNKANGFTVTASGLQYKVIQEGKGDSPKMGDSVTVNYRGTFIDGTEFDSSYKRSAPSSFPIGGVIPGWNEALQLMKPGGKYQLAVPAALAYGEQGHPGIAPNAVLLFEVELISFTKAPAGETLTPPTH